MPWTTTDSPTDSFLSTHAPSLRSTGLEASRRLSSSSPFSDHYFLPSLSRDSCSPEVSQGVTKEPESVIRLSRHSRSLSGLSGSSRASLSLTPSSEFMPPPSAVGIQSEPPRSLLDPSLPSLSASRLPYSKEREQLGAPYGDKEETGVAREQHGRADVGGVRKQPNSSLPYEESRDDAGSVGPVRSKRMKDKKTRERVRIALAPDQPPTTQGKERERVYVACQQW